MQNNYKAIEQVNAATQENSAGVEKIEDMVVRIRTLAGEQAYFAILILEEMFYLRKKY